jgi:glycosyltransferase involved in cell wall biosynthesis
MKCKHIYFVHLLNDNSGSPRVLCDMINSLSLHSDEYKKTILTSGHKGFLSNGNAKLIKFWYPFCKNKSLKLLSYLFSQITIFFMLSANLIFSRLKNEKTMVVINTLLPFGGGLAAKLFADNTIYYIHETTIRPIFLRRFLLLIADWCSNSILFVSNYVAENSAIERPSKKVIYNCLRSDFSSVSSLDLRSKFNNKTIMFVGSLKIYKGIEQFLLLSKKLVNFKFHAVLNCEELELKEFISGRVLPKNLRFSVRPNRIDKLYEKASVVVNFSIPELWVETFGLSLLEGMSFACPVIAPPVGGPTELVDETVAILIDSRDIERIIDFIEYLHSDFSIWQLYSNRALERSKKFSYEIYSKNINIFIKQQFDMIK